MVNSRTGVRVLQEQFKSQGFVVFTHEGQKELAALMAEGEIPDHKVALGTREGTPLACRSHAQGKEIVNKALTCLREYKKSAPNVPEYLRVEDGDDRKEYGTKGAPNVGFLAKVRGAMDLLLLLQHLGVQGAEIPEPDMPQVLNVRRVSERGSAKTDMQQQIQRAVEALKGKGLSMEAIQAVLQGTGSTNNSIPMPPPPQVKAGKQEVASA